MKYFMLSADKRATSDLIPRWWFGGVAAALACIPIHPLDILKVQLQVSNVSVKEAIHNITKERGIRGCFYGLSASLCRQLTYSTARFGIYEKLKAHYKKTGISVGVGQRLWMSAVSGTISGFVANPPDMVNIRMLSDIALPKEKRRNYKNVFHGLYLVFKEEGIQGLYKGSLFTMLRATVITVSIFTGYDTFKAFLLRSGFKDDIYCHIGSSMFASALATTTSQPVDVMKTRIMASKNPKIVEILGSIWKQHGPLGFWKGFVPALTRIGPQNTLIYVIFEFLRLNYGFYLEVK